MFNILNVYIYMCIYKPASDLNVLVREDNYYNNVADHDETNEDKINMNDEYTDFIKEFKKNLKKKKVINKRGGKLKNLSSKDSVHKTSHKFKKTNIPRKATLPKYNSFETSNDLEGLKLKVKNLS